MPNEFRQGDHICALYATEQEQLRISAAYVRDGLRRREQCLYVGSSPAALKRFDAALTRVGIDAGRMTKSGALIEATHADAHLAGGCFDSDRMLGLLNDCVERALNAGFPGLRTCGDMSWLLQEAAGSEQAVEYEALLNQFFAGVRGLGMCLYDRARLPPAWIDHALATHSCVNLTGRRVANPFYESLPGSATRAARPQAVPGKLTELTRILNGH